MTGEHWGPGAVLAWDARLVLEYDGPAPVGGFMLSLVDRATGAGRSVQVPRIADEVASVQRFGARRTLATWERCMDRMGIKPEPGYRKAPVAIQEDLCIPGAEAADVGEP